jgi:AsmA protein
MVRKLLIAVGVLLGLLVLAAAALLLFVDVNQFKPRIEQAASEQLKRKLSIDGDLKLSVFPRVAVQLPRTTLMEPDGKRVFAEVGSASVSVAVMPLLSGKLEADRVRIDGLSATIERRKDGSTSIDDLLAGRGKPAEPQPDAPAGAIPAFEIGGITLRNASFTLLDPNGPLLQVSKLNLETGPLAAKMRSRVALDGEVAAPQSKLQATVKLAADADVDLAAKAYAVRDLSLNLAGAQAAQKFDLSLATPQLAFGESTTGEKLQLKANLSGAQTLQATFDLTGFSGDAANVAVKTLAIALDMQQPQRKIAVRLASPVQFATGTQLLKLAKLTGEASIDDPTLPIKNLKLPIDGSVSADLKKQLVDTRISTKIEDTKLDVKLDVAGFAAPKIGFDLQADSLNIDRYFPPAPAPAAATPAAGEADAKLDLSALRGLNATGQVRVGKLQARGIKASDVKLGLKAAGGRAELAPLAAQLYGGSLAGSASAAADGNRIGISTTLTNIDIDALLRDAANKDLLAGRGNVKLAVAGGGATVNALKRSLDGNASLALRDGAIKGINLAQKFRDARQLISGGGADTTRADSSQKTDFSEMTASFVIKNGVAESSDLDAKSPLLRLAGAGRVDIGAGSIDYTTRVSVVGTLKGQDGREVNDLRGVTIPVRLSGPFTQMSWAIDWKGLAQEALKAKATEQLKEKLAPKLDQQKEQVKDRARDALKGLFGK